MVDTENNLILREKKCEKGNDEKKGWSILLPELLEIIMNRLVVKDGMRASVACKTWYNTNVCIRRKDQHMWLMKIPFSSKSKSPCELYDPSQENTYTMDYPEIIGMTVYHSKDGWLLMRKDRSSCELFFFNPFTRKLIVLPNCPNYNECAIFTCAPTSDDCLVFGLTKIENNNNLVMVNTFKMGETKWRTTLYPSPECFFVYYKKIVFSDGFFYCLSGLGWLAVFDPSKRTLNIHHMKCSSTSTTPWFDEFGTHLVEIKGGIFILETSFRKPRMFRLNLDDKDWIWEEQHKIEEGLTIFGDSCAYTSRSGLPSYMRNKLFLAHSHHPGINTYLLDEERYSPNNSYIPFLEVNTVFHNIWIDPPKQSCKSTT